MYVFMAETRLVALDGVNVRALNDGETYDVPDDVASRLIERGYAAEGDPEDVKGASPETKDLGAADENKTATDEEAPAPRRRRTRNRRS